MPFKSDDGKNWADTTDAQKAAEQEFKAMREEAMKEIPGVVGAAFVGLVLGVFSSVQLWHGSHWENIALGPICSVTMYALYRMEKTATLWILGIVGFFTLTVGAAYEAGELESYMKVFTPLFFYYALWQTRPFTAALITAVIISTIVLTVRLTRSPNPRITVKFADGSIGTIEKKEFDPENMEEV